MLPTIKDATDRLRIPLASSNVKQSESALQKFIFNSIVIDKVGNYRLQPNASGNTNILRKQK